jgi:hypothetical protein
VRGWRIMASLLGYLCFSKTKYNTEAHIYNHLKIGEAKIEASLLIETYPTTKRVFRFYRYISVKPNI